MTDYHKSTGSSGTMRIRDTGSTVEFWLNSNNGTTWSDHIPWGWTVNGSTGSGTYHYPAGSGWRMLGSWSVTYSQTVTFRLGNTGTSGFGGPTTFAVDISRSTVPGAPSAVSFSSVGSTALSATFSDGSDGGLAIDDREITWGTDPYNGTDSITFSGSASITDLTPGTLYYFWGRSHNANGWGAWSPRSSITTLNTPDAPTTPNLNDIKTTSVEVSWAPNGTGGSPITGFQVGYGTDPDTPTTTVSATSPRVITGLTPGTLYYFRVRAQNAVGYGPWSAAANAQTIAGVRIHNGTTWVTAIPYVKSGGVWKVAHPYVRYMGEWKPSS